MPFCLAKVPNCNDPSKFSDRQVYTNSVDPDQTPVPSGFTMFAILSNSHNSHNWNTGTGYLASVGAFW